MSDRFLFSGIKPPIIVDDEETRRVVEIARAAAETARARRRSAWETTLAALNRIDVLAELARTWTGDLTQTVRRLVIAGAPAPMAEAISLGLVEAHHKNAWISPVCDLRLTQAGRDAVTAARWCSFLVACP